MHLTTPGDAGLPRRDLRALLAPASACVIGASERTAAADLLRNLDQAGCRVAGIHPAKAEVLGYPCAARVAELPFVPELAAVAVGAGRMAAAVEEALAAGVRAFVIPGLGPEDGEDGRSAREQVRSLLLGAGASLIGPNCMGVWVPQGPSAWIATLPEPSEQRRGRVACVVGSGSIGEALMNMGPRLGIRALVSSGNESVRDAADWLAFLAEDEETQAIGLFLEAVRRPAAFVEALARATEAEKPVVLIKVGRSAAAAAGALAHTGAIVGSDRSFDAVCRGYGAIRVDDLRDFVEHLEVLGSPRRPGRRPVVVANSGGESELLADAAEAAGIPLVELPAEVARDLDGRFAFHGVRNPIDYWAVADQEEVLPAAVDAAAAHPEVDTVIVGIDQSWRFRASERRATELSVETTAKAAQETGTFCAVVSNGTADAASDLLQRAGAAGVPMLTGSYSGLRAIAAAARWRPTRPARPAASAPVALPELDGRSGALPEADSKRLLARYGLDAPAERRAATPEEAVAAATAIGYPVVVKVDGPAHKERDGGVVLGCGSAEAVHAAAARIGGPVLIAEELRGGVEVLCGMVRDEQYGPLVVCGVGGSWAEAVAESARAALAPIALSDADALVRSVAPIAARLDAAGIAAVAATLVALGRAAGEHPRIREIDINPLRIGDGRAVALDALLVLSAD